MKKIGLYIHIPFCNGKCPYCDFYSLSFNNDKIDEYTEHLAKKIITYKDSSLLADTIYFGGGTPSLLGTERLIYILDSVYSSFGKNSIETTIEVNPESSGSLDFQKLYYHGINRVSVGLQSANDNELKLLGRKHTADDVKDTVKNIKKGGINNISLDLMLGISGQTMDSLDKSIDFCRSIDAEHISAYILKIEENTVYYRKQNQLILPNDDDVCDFYEHTVNKLSEYGYHQYEISNFAKKGKESKHNMKYWKCEEYLGLGPSAHSFLNGKRFYYNRKTADFYNDLTVDDGVGGGEEEYIAMALRLCDGIN